MDDDNLLLDTDSYKISHWRQYPPGSRRVSSFWESRGGRFPDVTFFGLQYYLKRYLAGQVVTEEKIREAEEVFGAHFGDHEAFNAAGWRHILAKHGGRLPVEIRAVAEGTTVPVSNALMTIENTDPEVPWLTNYLETMLSMVWYPTTVATQSRAMRALILGALERTGDPSLIAFKLHDFGFRGSTSKESASIGAGAHLVNFQGTDTLPGIMFARRYYHERMAGSSIPAAEHSTITSWGREHEADAFRNMLEKFPTGLVAVVSDSYDIFHACEQLWGRELRDLVLRRDGTLIVRPDSGYPPEIVVRVLDILGRAFGFTVNAKGFRVLNPHVRVIQGDGIDHKMLGLVLEAMEKAGWSADNIAFGSGGGLLQKLDRDMQKCAIKCSAIDRDGVWHDVHKDPITDPGKRSKAGRLMLINDGGYRTVRVGESDLPNLLELAFRNGDVLRDQTFADIRRLALL